METDIERRARWDAEGEIDAKIWNTVYGEAMRESDTRAFLLAAAAVKKSMRDRRVARSSSRLCCGRWAVMADERIEQSFWRAVRNVRLPWWLIRVTDWCHCHVMRRCPRHWFSALA